MMLLKKAVHEKLAAIVNNMVTSEFVLKTKYQTDKTELEKKISNVTDFIKKQNSLNQKTKFQTLVIQQQKPH